jgi:hypothetical protein
VEPWKREVGVMEKQEVTAEEIGSGRGILE